MNAYERMLSSSGWETENGFAVFEDLKIDEPGDGKVLRAVQGVEPGSTLRARLVDGELGLLVRESRPAKPRG